MYKKLTWFIALLFVGALSVPLVSAESVRERLKKSQIEEKNKDIEKELKELREKIGRTFEESIIMYDEIISPSASELEADKLQIKQTRDKYEAERKKQLPKNTLQAFSIAAETFAKANKGQYPANSKKLTKANPPYIDAKYLHCDEEREGYYYKCSFSPLGYTFTATSVYFGRNWSNSLYDYNRGSAKTLRSLNMLKISRNSFDKFNLGVLDYTQLI